MPPPDLATALLQILDAGDRAEAALASGDIRTLQTELRRRGDLVGALPRPAQPHPETADLVDRLRHQGDRLRVLVRQRLDDTRDALGQTNRAAMAYGSYGQVSGRAPQRVDTQPRTIG